MQNNIKCPNCNSLMYFTLDEWGRTPWHLHCDNCDINIGTTNMNKAIELIKTYHEPHTYIEYYGNRIQVLMQNDFNEDQDRIIDELTKLGLINTEIVNG